MKKILFSIFVILNITITNAQISFTKSSVDNKWVFGGGLGFNFNNGFNVNLSPTIGYKVANGLVAGIGAGINYNTNNNSQTTSLGIGPWLQYVILQNFYTSASYRYNSYNTKITSTNQSYSNSENTMLLGAGYILRTGAMATQIGFTYNPFYDKNTSSAPSAFTPTIGVMFGL